MEPRRVDGSVAAIRRIALFQNIAVSHDILFRFENDLMVTVKDVTAFDPETGTVEF